MKSLDYLDNDKSENEKEAANNYYGNLKEGKQLFPDFDG